MKVPSRNIAFWAKEIIDECTVSRPKRLMEYRFWRDVFFTGSDNDIPSKHNRCYSHIDKLSSYLFSPSDVRFQVDFDEATRDPFSKWANAASNYLNRQFARRNCDITFAEANEWSLVKGATIMKLVWSRSGLEPWVIQPENFGVLREDIEDLDRQDAFTHTFYLTPTQFRRLLGDRRDRTELMARVAASYSADAESAISNAGGHDINLGGLAGIGIPGIYAPTQNATGTVSWTTAAPVPMLAPEVVQRLIRIDDLWVWNDEREDWTTIRYVDPGIVIEGEMMHRNLSDVPGEHPFVKVCSNPTPGYFWGRSEIANIWPNQKMLSQRLTDIDQIFRMQAKPSRAIIGGSGITDERARMLLTPGGVLTDSSPTTKVETFKPEMPSGALEYLGYLDSCFDEAAGFTAMTNGQGESGVRAGTHANTLLRTSTPRLRDRALVTERQAAQFGDLCLKMLRAKDPEIIYTDDDKGEIFLANLPEDASVTVDSHTSSPAFSGDNQNLLFALAKAGAVGPQELIEGTHPPREEILIARLHARDKAHQKQLEELRQQDPEQWAKAISGSGRRH